jgi:hypothetical protein
MKRNEIIELGGKEYTLELNRESFLQIDKICNVQKSMEIIQRGFYDYVDEIDDDYNPFENMVSDEEIDEEVALKEETLKKLVENSFFIWLYPNYKLPISKVRKLVDPYLKDEEKSEWIGAKIGEYLRECISIRESYNQERKNLKAQINK